MTIVKHDRGRARLSGRTARPESHWIRSVSQRRSFGPVIAVCSPRPRRGTPGSCSARLHPAGVSGRVGTSGLLSRGSQVRILPGAPFLATFRRVSP